VKTNFVYILKSAQYELHYIGHTSNLEDRIKRHNTNRSKYTHNKGPWEIIAYTQCNSKSEAYRLEQYLKKQKDITYAIEVIKRHNPNGQSTPI